MPTISSMSATTGGTKGGNRITIDGTGFPISKESNVVYTISFGSVDVQSESIISVSNE